MAFKKSAGDFPSLAPLLMVDDDSKRWRRTLTRAIHRRVSHVSTHGDHGDDNDDGEDDDDDDDARDVRGI